MSNDIRELEQTLASDPHNRDAFAKLEEQYFEARRWQELVRLYEGQEVLQREMSGFWERAISRLEKLMGKLEEPPERADILIHIGRIWEFQMERRDQAMVNYQKAFKVWPYKTESLDLARDIYARQGNWKLVLRLFDLQLQVEKDAERQGEIHREKGRILLEELEMQEHAVGMLRKAVELSPGDSVARELLAKATGEQPAPDAPAPEVEINQERAAAQDEASSGGPETVLMPAVSHEQIEEARAQASEPEEAPAAQGGGAEESQAAPAAGLSERDRLSQELSALREELARSKRGAAAAIHVSIARKLQAFEPDSPEIEVELKAALERNASSTEARDMLKALYRDAERWEDLLELLEQTAGERTVRKEDARAALMELASIQREQFGDEAAAVETFEKVLAMDPSHPDALRFAEDFYEREENWEALVSLYENALRLKRSSPAELDLRLQLGQMLWKKVGDLDAAERHFRRVRLADPKRPEMLRFYQHHFKAQANWKKYYSTLATLRGVLDDSEESLAISVEMARVAREEMNSPAKAIDVWKSVLKQDSGNERARRELHELYIEAGKWNALLEHYKEEITILEREDSDESRLQQVDFLSKMVDIYRDRLRLDVMVINTYNAILQIDPVNSAAIDALAARYEKSKRWNDLINILQKKVDVVGQGEPSETLPILHRIAELWQKRLGNVNQAIPALERVLEIDAGDVEAIKALKAIYNKRHKWPELLVVLEKEAELLEGRALAAHLAEMARLAHQRLNEPERARDLHERVCQALEGEGDEVEDAPLYRGALSALEDLYRSEGDDQALVSVYERRLKVTSAKGQRVEILEQLAALLYESLNESERACELWGQILGLDPDHGGSLQRLTDHYVRERRWDDLATLFGDRGDWPRLFEIFDTGAEMVSDEDERVGLFHRMAKLAEEQLKDADRVILSLESVLNIQPENIEVASALLPYYRDAGEHAKEIQVNKILLDNEGGDAFVLSLEIARLYEEKIEDLASAFDWSDRAFRMKPQDEALRAQMEELARSSGRLAELVATCRQVAEQVDDEAVRLAIYRTVARTANVDLEWHDDAVDYYERILRADGEDVEAVDSLLLLYRELERWEDLLDVMQRKIGLQREAGDDAGCVALYFQMAELLSARLERRVDAIDAYRTILDMAPESLDALRGLKALYEAGEDWVGVAEAMEGELALLDKQGDAVSAAQLRLSLGHLNENQLDDADKSVGWYASLLDGEDSARAPAVSALEGLLERAAEQGEDARQVRIATLLEPVHRRDENTARLTEMLEIRLGAMDEDAEKVSTLWELAELYEQHNEELGGAFHSVERLLALTPADDKVWNELERIGGNVDRWEEIADLYAGLTPTRDALDVDPWRFQLLRRQARVYEQELGRDLDARESYETLLLRDETDRLTIDSLEKVYGRLGAYAELVELLGRKAALVEERDARREVLFQIAAIYEEQLHDPDSAILTFRQALEDQPGDGEALDQLERLLAAQERWVELVELLERRTQLVEDEASRLDIRFQLGQVLQTRLDDLGEAIAVYRGVVQEDPTHRALGALESLSAELYEGDGELSLRREIDDTLEPIYQEAEAWEKLVHVLGLKLGYAEEDADRVTLRLRTARLYRDRLEQPQVAFEHLRAAVALSFEDDALRAELEVLADQIGAHDQVIELYERSLVESAVSDELQRAVLQRMATLHEEKLEDVASAVDAYRRMLDFDAEDGQALASLERLHEQELQWAELVEVVQRQADMAQDDEVRVERLRKVGALYRDKLEDPSSAIETYQRIVTIKERDAGALDAMEELYLGQEAWRELIAVLHDKVAIEEAVADRRALLFRIAELHEKELLEPHEAINIYNDVLDLLPEDADALNALDRLYEEHERFPELAGVLSRKFGLEQDAQVRNALQYRLAQVQQHQLFEIDEAIATYADTLSRQADYEPARKALVALLEDPEHRFAASEVLEPLYRAEERHQLLVDLLELQLLDLEDDAACLKLLDDVALLQEAELGDKESAFHAVRRAYLLDPSAAQRVASLERLADETLLYDSLVKEAYEPALPNISDGAEVLRVYLKVATVTRDELQDASGAEAAFRNALMHEPESLEAMEALEVMLTEQERWHDLLDVLREKFGVLEGRDDHAPALSVLFKIAHIHDAVLSQPADAIETYRRVLEMDEANAEAIHALKGLYRREERWEDLTALLIKEIGYASDVATAVSLRSELATVYQHQLFDLVEAIEVYRRVLVDAPDHAETIEALEGMFAERTEEQLAAEILEPIYRRRTDWARLVDVLEVRLLEQEDDATREASLTQIARLNEEKLSRNAEALEAYQRLFDQNPTVPGVWDQMERLAAELEAWEQVADVYGQVLDHNMKVTEEVRLALLLRRAVVLDERLERVEDARPVYREVLFIDDENSVAQDALERILTKMEEWFDLVDLYRRAAELTDDDAHRLRLYFKMAAIQDEILRDPDNAIETYRVILEQDSEERDAISGLERLYQQEERWRELADLYRREAMNADDEAQALSLRHQLATVLCAELDEVAESIGIYREILEADPQYKPTRSALEGLLREVSESDLQLQIAMMLQPLYDEETEWEQLIFAYEVQLDVVQDPASRVELLHEVARLREERQGDLQAAFEAYARAFEEDVRSETLQAHLERLSERLGNWGALIEIYLAVMGHSANTGRVVQLLHRAAELYIDKRQDADSAITVYRQVLDVDDRNRDAIQKLEVLYQNTEQWQSLVDVLSRKADLEENVLERKETLYRVAELWEKSLEDDREAIEVYQQIMGLDDEDLAAIEALERLYERTEGWDFLINILMTKVDVVEEEEEKIAVHARMAHIYETHMMETDEAIAAFLTIRDLQPENLEAIRSLNRLYGDEARWDDLLDILEVERQLLDSGDELNTLEFRMAQLLEQELDQPERAILVYEGIVGRQPGHSLSLEALEALINEPRCLLEAARVLEPIYERSGEWRKLVDALELTLQEMEEPEQRRQTLERIAGIHEQQLSSRQMAFITFGRAFNEVPSQPEPRRHLERLALEMGNYDELVAIYEEKLEELYDFELVVELSMRLGEIDRVELGDKHSAVERYRRVLSVEEYHQGALNALDELFSELEDWQELVDVLERKVQNVEGEEQVSLKYRLAHKLDTHFEEHGRALGIYREILDAQPAHVEAREALERLAQDISWRAEIADILEPLYVQNEDWERLVNLLRLRLELMDFPADRCATLRRVAELSEARLSRPDTAFEAYCEALQADPEDGLVWPHLERLAESCGTWRRLTEVAEQVAEEIGDDVEQRETLLKTAGWYREKLGELGEAERVYRQVVDGDPGNEAALQALEGIYTEQRRYSSLYDVIAQRAELVFEADARKALYARMAEIATEQLAEPDKAIDAWNMLRDVDDTDTQALKALDALYTEEQMWDRLVDVLDRRAELSDEMPRRVAMRLRIGAVARDEMDDADASIDAYRQVLDLEAGNSTALDALEALFTKTEQWPDLQEVLSQSLTFAEGDEARIALHFKLAELNETRFEDLDGAMEHLRSVTLIDAEHTRALSELERLYAKAERWYDLQEVYIQRLEQVTDPQERLRLHVAISNVAAEHLGDVATAKEHLQLVLDAEPDNMSALDVLGKLYAADFEWEQALGVLERQLAMTDAPAELSRLQLRRGVILNEEMSSPQEAKAAFRAAVDLDNAHSEAIEALRGSLRADEDWAGLIELYKLEGGQLTDAAAKVKLYTEMAEVASEKLGDAGIAVEALEIAYEASEQDMAVAEPLLQAYVDAERWDRAEPILEGIIEDLTNRRRFKQLFKFHHMRGQIATKKGDDAQALASFQAAYDIDATYVPNLLSLGKLYVNQEDWDAALKIFQTLLLHQMKIKNQDDKRDVYYNLGRIRQMKGDERRAKDMFNRALSIDRGHAPSIAALETLS